MLYKMNGIVILNKAYVVTYLTLLFVINVH